MLPYATDISYGYKPELDIFKPSIIVIIAKYHIFIISRLNKTSFQSFTQ